MRSAPPSHVTTMSTGGDDRKPRGCIRDRVGSLLRVWRQREKEWMEGSKSERARGRGAVRQSGRPPGKQGRQAGRQATIGRQAGRQASKLAGSQCTSQDH
ncbi:hypothetical protein ALC53_10995 [Atta colombica]|uniref:Uncharacterized protein n=1 Tax=Atta colombica TaxID=520822 RepID=A0A195B227_9HYME|nr:hypothetical protein ALC53_10995 [Atta colombica]